MMSKNNYCLNLTWSKLWSTTFSLIEIFSDGVPSCTLYTVRLVKNLIHLMEFSCGCSLILWTIDSSEIARKFCNRHKVYINNNIKNDEHDVATLCIMVFIDSCRHQCHHHLIFISRWVSSSITLLFYRLWIW